jgi:RNA polymerase sigma factor (sigma-70 family)
MERIDTTSEPGDASWDAHGFAAFYTSELTRQVRSASLIVGSTNAAHDIVHDAFVAVYARWGSISEPGPYLQQCVLNACRDALRRRTVAERFLQRSSPAVDERVPDPDLFDALRRLPFNHRAAVVLRYYLDLSEHEIARHLGCRPGSVGPWIRRGLDALAADLSRQEESP